MSLPDWSDDAFAAAQPLMDQWADYYALPRTLVYGQVSQESRFNPSATGKAGEIGLMQIKPSTAAGVGFSGDPSQLYDPSTNLQYGLAYLAQQVATYGDYDTALSAYNAGHPITGNQAYVDGVNARAAYFQQAGAIDVPITSGAGLALPIAIATAVLVVALPKLVHR